MKITSETPLRELAFCVCTALDRVGVTAVLTGGGAASFHAPGAIQSYDLDFILEVYPEGGAPGAVLEDLGFRRVGHDYRHRVSPFQLEFPPGPLAVGGERIEVWDTHRDGARLLHVITPTDCCRDRLAAFYYFGDRGSLEQACAVFAASQERVDLEIVRVWSEEEGAAGKYHEFLDRIGHRGDRGR